MAPRGAQEQPRRPSRGSKRPPRGAQEWPGAPQDSPNCHPECPKRHQGAAKCAPEPPRRPPGAHKRPRGRIFEHKMHETHAKDVVSQLPSLQNHGLATFPVRKAQPNRRFGGLR